ncbi:MAG: redox-regulated ATPase YchF [Desulfobacterales bacterium]|jgi:hypothetical protein
MNIGLIGLPNSGKTTVFNALAKSQARVSSHAQSDSEPNRAVLDVVDDRVKALCDMYRPRKTTYAAIELIDFAGLTQGAARQELFSSAAMALIKNMDAIALVVRNFENDLSEPPTPLQDIEKLEAELLISDLIIAESRLERVEKDCRRGKKAHLLEAEKRLLHRLIDHLNNNQPIRLLKLDAESEKMIRGFQFLTQKPAMVIVNSDENNFAKHSRQLEAVHQHYRVVEFAGKFEMELSQLEDQEEIALFMADIGIKESARDRLCKAAYELLGYISFFTVGADEVRAWSIKQGESAQAAAAKIHTDLARGFIRAECFTFNDLIAHGSEKQLGAKGLLRLEGKNYIVQDGNVLNIRFNI